MFDIESFSDDLSEVEEEEVEEEEVDDDDDELIEEEEEEGEEEEDMDYENMDEEDIEMDEYLIEFDLDDNGMMEEEFGNSDGLCILLFDSDEGMKNMININSLIR